MRREKAIDVIASYVVRDDMRGAMRFYVENRIGFRTYTEAVRKGRALVEYYRQKEGGR